MREIIITRGQVVIVDDDDFEYLKNHSWHCCNNGYACRSAKINGKYTTIKMHRVITNAPEWLEVDHINHNRLDNRKGNLRVCTRSQNNMNRKRYSGSSSIYKGVSFCRRSLKWAAYIALHGKQQTLGRFDTEEEAALAYNQKAVELFGEFAHLNQIGVTDLWGKRIELISVERKTELRVCANTLSKKGEHYFETTNPLKRYCSKSCNVLGKYYREFA